MGDLETFLNTAADVMTQSIDLDALLARGRDLPEGRTSPISATKPRTFAIARDAAFAFRYAHDDAALTAAGHSLRYFSPLADDPVPHADQIILPGGYPELHANTLAKADSAQIAPWLSDAETGKPADAEGA